jgi:TonB family protein
MNSLLLYILSASICLTLFMLGYQLFMRNSTRFNLCRFYLLSSIALSFLIPSIPIDLGFKSLINVESASKVEFVQSYSTEALADVPTAIVSNGWDIDPLKILGIVLVSISILLAIRFVYRFGSIILIQMTGNRLENDEGFDLIFTDKTDNAFSFLGQIFINPLKFTDEEKRLIIEHEREHIRHFHSIDLIIIELLIVFQWFNPFAYIARRKLIEIHEFIADNGVIRNGADPYSYQNLLLSVVTSSCLPSAGNQLSALITKKRIAMIGKPMNQTGKWVNFLILIPIALILIVGISAFTPKHPISKNEKNERQIPQNSKIDTTSAQAVLHFRSHKEISDGVLNSFQVDLAPPVNSQAFSVILKGGSTYKIFYLSNSPDDKLLAKIESGKLENKMVEKESKFSFSCQITFTPKETNAYQLVIENLSSKKTNAVIILAKESPEILNVQKKDTLKEKVVPQTEEEVFLVVEKMPSFGTGEKGEFREWVATNMKYPEEAADKGIQGRVFVQFIVEADGKLTNVKIIRGVDPLLDKEAIRVVEMSPKWNPGMQRGKPVRVSFTFPITFSLDKSEPDRNNVDFSLRDDSTAYIGLKEKANKELTKTLQRTDFFMNLKPRRFNMYLVNLKEGCTYSLYVFPVNNQDEFHSIIYNGDFNTSKEKALKELESNVSYSKSISFTPKQSGPHILSLENLTANKTSVLMVVTSNSDKNVIAEWAVEEVITKEPKIIITDEVFLVVEKMPSFGNGDANEFRRWVAVNLKYPEEEAKKGIQGRVFVQFVIEKDGSVTNTKVIRSSSSIAIDNEALRVVSSSPKWNPGTQRGEPVRVQYTFPITFSLK